MERASETGERAKTVDNRFDDVKSAKAEENRAECTDATVFDQRRGLESRYKLYKRLTNAACGILAQCCKRELRKTPSTTPLRPTRQILRMFSHPFGWLFALALCQNGLRSRSDGVRIPPEAVSCQRVSEVNLACRFARSPPKEKDTRLGVLFLWWRR